MWPIMKNSKTTELGVFKLNTADFGFMNEEPPPGNPFDNVDYPGDLEGDCKAELNEYQKTNKEHLRSYSKTMDGVFDSEFWFAVAFKDRETKEAFLKEFGIDKLGDKYIDGGKLAKLLRKL